MTLAIPSLGMTKVKVTGSDGSVTVPDIPETVTATIKYEKSGYVSVEASQTVGDISSQFTMVRECSLTVKATAASGSSIASVKVTLTVDGQAQELSTGNDGQAVFEKLSESDTASIKLEKSGYNTVDLSKQVRDNCNAIVPVVLERICRLTIKVTQASGSVLDLVKATLTINGQSMEMSTGNDGLVTFETLSESATAAIRLEKSGFITVNLSKQVGDNCNALLPVTLEYACSLTIKVSGIGGTGIDLVKATLTVNGQGNEMNTGNNGQVTFDNLPGSALASISLEKSGYTTVDLSTQVRDNCDAILPVTLDRECSLTIRAIGISGSVINLVKTTLTINGQSIEMSTGIDGQVAFGTLSESASAAINLEKSGYIAFGMTTSIKDNCDALLSVTLERSCGLVFKVTDASGSDMNAVSVTLTTDDLNEMVVSGSDGVASFLNIPETAIAAIQLQKSGYVTIQMTALVQDNCNAVIPVTISIPCSFTLKITNALEGDSIGGASVIVTSSTTSIGSSFLSANNGYADINNLNSVCPSTEFTVVVQKATFDDLSMSLVASDVCSSSTLPAALNPTSPDGRIIMSWNTDELDDLDIMMMDSTYCRVYYGDTTCRLHSLDKDNYVSEIRLVCCMKYLKKSH